MARIVVAYDPEGRLAIPEECDRPPEMRFALLDIGELREPGDIYLTAQRLARMLLNQIEKPCQS